MMSIWLLALLAEPRCTHTATLLDDGTVLVAGGFHKDGFRQIYSATTEVYARGAFRPGPRLVTARGGHTATRLTDGRLLIAGGWGESGMLASAELFDGRAFVSAGAMTRPRGGFTATRLLDGRVLIAGGGDNDVTDSAEIFDPRTGRFSLTGAMATPRLGHTATLLSDGRVLIAGGASRRGEVLASAEIYDPATARFAPAGPMATARYKHAAIALPDGRVLVLGGSDARDWGGQLASAEMFDPRAGAFAAAPSLNEARFKHPNAVVLLGDGSVLVAGGGKTVERFAGGRFTVVGQLDVAPHYGTATRLAGGGVLIVGGYGAPSRTERRTWIYRE